MRRLLDTRKQLSDDLEATGHFKARAAESSSGIVPCRLVPPAVAVLAAEAVIV